MSLTGNISTMSLAEIFQWLSSGRKTGTLQVDRKDGIKKEVYFQDGSIVSASSNDPRELIGQFLLVTNQINEQQLSEALERQKHDHVLLGKILVQQKFISDDNLLQTLQTISEEIIFDLFLWKEGRFEFQDGNFPERDMPPLSLDITHIVLEGARREDEWLRIKQIFPDESVVVRPSCEGIVRNLPLEFHNARLLALVNGSRNLRDITRLFKSTQFNVCRMLLDLYEQGMVEVGDFRALTLQATPREKRDPVREVKAQIEALLRRGRLDDAEKGMIKLQQLGASSDDIRELRKALDDKRFEDTAKKVVNPDAVPVLAMDVDRITKLDLGPEEGFIVSRINGSWDVKSIIKISPFDERICFKIFKQFMDDGVISFK